MKKYAFTYLLFCLLSVQLACTNDTNPTERAPIDIPTQTVTEPVPETEESGFFETYESTNRGIWQKPDLILETLGDLSDKVVADIGAGTGYLTLRTVPKAKKVIAIDIDPRFVNYLDSVRVNGLDSIYRDRLEPRLARPDNPNLQPQEVDVVTIVNTYMYIENRVEYLKTLQNGMAEDGRLLIIDFKKKNTSIGPPSDIRIPLYQVERELKEAGFSNVRTNDAALNYQYLVMGKR
ncbi:MAG: class I SAM-dependent methyltransferase [Saprospiraceae bacterium]